jgi:hypothetical protein
MMSASTCVCWTAFLYVLWTVDPFSTNWIGFTLFYTSLFLTIIGSSALVGFIVRFILMKQELAFRAVKEAFRQSFLFALLIVISLVLLSKGVFTWLNILFLVVGLTVLEFFMLSYEKPSTQKIENEINSSDILNNNEG